MYEKLIHIISVIIGVPPETLSEDSSKGKVAYWDSLKHMNIVLELEEEFNVYFTDEEISKIISIKDMIEVLIKKGITKEKL